MSSLKKAVKVLRNEGYIEKDIVRIVTEWGKAAFSRLYSEMMLAFSEKEIEELEKIGDKREMEMKVRERFREKTGKDPDRRAREYLDIIASEFLTAYRKDTAADS